MGIGPLVEQEGRHLRAALPRGPAQGRAGVLLVENLEGRAVGEEALGLLHRSVGGDVVQLGDAHPVGLREVRQGEGRFAVVLQAFVSRQPPHHVGRLVPQQVGIGLEADLHERPVADGLRKDPARHARIFAEASRQPFPVIVVDVVLQRHLREHDPQDLGIDSLEIIVAPQSPAPLGQSPQQLRVSCRPAADTSRGLHLLVGITARLEDHLDDLHVALVDGV